MTAIPDHEIEALAREMLRETILRSGWYPELSPEDRVRRIEEDVERYWHLMATEARERLAKARA
jgi:hypothetical protein